MRVNIEKKIFEKQSDTGVKLDDKQKQEIIDRAIDDTVVKPLWFGRESRPIPAMAFTPSELEGQMQTLTPKRQAAVIRSLQADGIKNPTQSQIETAWQSMRKLGTK
jgi:hypothetical protein